MSRLNKEIWGWALYDWANSAYAVSILAVIFQFYFIDVLATSGADSSGELIKKVTLFGTTIPSASLWSWSVALSMIFVALLCPVVGAIADYAGKKKRCLLFFCYTGAAATMLMICLKTGMWQTGMLLFILSNICFVGGNAVCNGLIVDVAPSEKEIGFISGFGWAIGYMASFLMLLFNLLLIHFEIPTREWAIRISFLSVGIWWAVFAIPTFRWVKEKAKPKPLPEGQTLLTAGFFQLRQTAKSLPRYPVMLLFIAAYLLYNDGIQTAIAEAATFTNYALNASLEAIMPAFLMIQLVAFFGSLAFIQIEKHIGTKRSLLYSLLGWTILIGWALIMQTLTEFYVMAFFAGLILGVSQSASRTIYALLIPPDRAAEFFSLYAIVGKIASVIGPILFGWGALYADRLQNIPLVNTMAAALLPLLIMVILGTLLLLKVDIDRGRAQAKAATH
ncbi:MFS transporter [Verrucomicrobiota bacterium]